MKRRQGAPLAGSVAAVQKTPLNLIHRNKSPTPVSMRVSARFDYPEGVPFSALVDAMKLPFPLAVELMRRAAR